VWFSRCPTTAAAINVADGALVGRTPPIERPHCFHTSRQAAGKIAHLCLLAMVKDIATCSYRHGWLSFDELKTTFLELARAAYDNTGECPS
jgi:hypothetical protein